METRIYPEYIMKNIRQNLGLEPDDTSKDSEIMQMPKEEALERFLIWEGIIGYGNLIISAVSDICNGIER